MILRFETDKTAGCKVNIIDLDRASIPELKTLFIEMELNKQLLLSFYNKKTRRGLNGN